MGNATHTQSFFIIDLCIKTNKEKEGQRIGIWIKFLVWIGWGHFNSGSKINTLIDAAIGYRRVIDIMPESVC